MHPGIVRGTKHMRHSPLSKSFVMKIAIGPWAWLLMKTPEQGAQTIIYMAVATELSDTSGKYFRYYRKFDRICKLRLQIFSFAAIAV